MADPLDGMPLVVDLDGTLVRSDLLVEGAWGLFGTHPVRALSMLAWLWRGRARLKRRVAESTVLDPTLLPYNAPVVERIAQARRAGRKVYLASASDERQVAAVARHLGMFDGWFGSDGVTNLKGAAKARRLTEAFGDGGFDYIGDAHADIPVWKCARVGVVVSRSARLARRVASLGKQVERITTEPPTATTCFRLLRPHQWSKNLLVGVPLLTSHLFTLEAAVNVLLAFAAFCLGASSVYVLNDMVDVLADRGHPTKRTRPFASGELGLGFGGLIAPALFAAGALTASWVSSAFLAVVISYCVASIAYTLVLKRKMFIDVVTLAGLYTIRVIGGAVAIGVIVSHWILAFSMFIFVALALVKRWSELTTRLEAGLPDPANRNYRRGDVPVLMSLAAAAGYSAVIVFSLYLSSDAVVPLYRAPQILWLAVPLLTYWISRLLLLTHRRLVHDDPVVFALRDRISLATGALMLLLIVCATFLSWPTGDKAGQGQRPARTAVWDGGSA